MAAGLIVTGSGLRLPDTSWDDLRIVPSAFDFAGSADPNLVSWQPSGGGATFKAWEFTTSDEAFFLCQLPHSWRLGSDLKAHIHWTPGARGTAEADKTVAWKLDISAASIGAVFPASSTLDLTDTCTGTNHLHEISPSVTLSGAGLGLSAMLMCRIYRHTGDSWATNTAGNCPILLEVDFHYEVDAFGSDSELSK